MTCSPVRAPSVTSASATWRFRASDSITHGPAMRNGVEPSPNWGMSAGGAGGHRRLNVGRRGGGAAGEGGADEAGEQGMWPHRSRLELRMELAPDEPGVVRQLDHLDQRAVGGKPRTAHAVLGEHVAVGVGDFVAMAMALT